MKEFRQNLDSMVERSQKVCKVRKIRLIIAKGELAIHPTGYYIANISESLGQWSFKLGEQNNRLATHQTWYSSMHLLSPKLIEVPANRSWLKGEKELQLATRQPVRQARLSSPNLLEVPTEFG